MRVAGDPAAQDPTPSAVGLAQIDLQITPRISIDPPAGSESQESQPAVPSSPGVQPTITPSIGGGQPTITPSIGGGQPTITPSIGGGQPTITPSIGGGQPTITPSIGGGAPASGTQGAAGGGITVANPQQLETLSAGKRELKLVIATEDPQPVVPPAEPLGFLEVFTALLAAMLIAPLLQSRLARWSTYVNAFGFVQKNGLVVSAYLIIFCFGWIIFMIVLPQLYMLDFSFRFNLDPGDIGGPRDVYTLKNYEYLIFGRPGDEELFNYLHLAVFVKTILASAFVTLLNFALCYPLAFYMAQAVKGRSQRLLFLCLLLPFWVNEILRAFAFLLIFSEQGLINVVLVDILGIWRQPFEFIQNDVALYSGLTYAYILLMIFPLYNAIESLDHNQIEAARDLGSPWWRIHFRVVMPHAKPGIASGCTMVFMLTAGALAAPNILGGPSSLWFTQVIYQWFNTGGNWPQGSAYAFVLLVSCIIFVRIMMRLFKVGLGDIARR